MHLCLRVNDMPRWLSLINMIQLTAITELDCEEQFNKIKPQWIKNHITKGAHYLLTHKRHWRMGGVV